MCCILYRIVMILYIYNHYYYFLSSIYFFKWIVFISAHEFYFVFFPNFSPIPLGSGGKCANDCVVISYLSDETIAKAGSCSTAAALGNSLIPYCGVFVFFFSHFMWLLKAATDRRAAPTSPLCTTLLRPTWHISLGHNHLLGQCGASQSTEEPTNSGWDLLLPLTWV